MENNSYPGFWDSRVDKSKTGGLVWLPGWLRCLIKSYSLIDFKQRWRWRFIDVRRRNKVECFSAVFHCFAQRTEEIVSKSFFSLFDSFQLRELRAISLWLQICFKKAELCVIVFLLCCYRLKCCNRSRVCWPEWLNIWTARWGGAPVPLSRLRTTFWAQKHSWSVTGPHTEP